MKLALILMIALTPMASSRRIQSKVATVISTEKKDNQDTEGLESSFAKTEDASESETKAEDINVLKAATEAEDTESLESDEAEDATVAETEAEDAESLESDEAEDATVSESEVEDQASSFVEAEDATVSETEVEDTESLESDEAEDATESENEAEDTESIESSFVETEDASESETEAEDIVSTENKEAQDNQAQYVSGGSDGSCPGGSVRVQNAECQQLSGVTLSNGDILSSYGREDCASHFTPGQGCFYNHAGNTYSTTTGCAVAVGQANHLAVCKAQAIPTAPGCWVVTPSGCPKQALNHQTWTRDDYQGASSNKARCERRKAEYNGWCGSTDTQVVFVQDSASGGEEKLIPGSIVALKGGRHGKYCADEGNKIKCNRGGIGPWEKFKVVNAGAGRIALKGGKNGFRKFCADEGNTIKCNRGGIGPWEKFQVHKAGHGKIALRGGRHRKVCADEGNTVKCNRGGIGPWEKFSVKCLSGSCKKKKPKQRSGPYYQMKKGSCCCPAADRITSHQDCKKAHDALGLDRSKTWTGRHGGIPGGCSTRHPILHWETSGKSGKARGDLTPICKKSSDFVVFEGQGHCRHGQIYASRAWELAPASNGRKGFNTPEYKAWVQEAWRRCLKKHSGVKFVSAWTDAGYRCYTAKKCKPNGGGGTRSWQWLN